MIFVILLKNGVFGISPKIPKKPENYGKILWTIWDTFGAKLVGPPSSDPKLAKIAKNGQKRVITGVFSRFSGYLASLGTPKMIDF